MRTITSYITFRVSDVTAFFLHPRDRDSYISEDVANFDIVNAIAKGYQWIRTDGEYAIFAMERRLPEPSGSSSPHDAMRIIRDCIVRPLYQKPSNLPTWRDLLELLRVRRDGSLGPLFINRSQIITPYTWLPAECHPTPGFAVRPGWHVAPAPAAPHLSTKGRIWMHVEIRDYEILTRPACQGGIWWIAKWMRVLGPVKQPTPFQSHELFSLTGTL